MSGDLKIRPYPLTIRYILCLALLLVLVSCKNSTEQRITDTQPGRDEMAMLNKYLVKKDKERIQNYIERKKLDMIESPSGLWYQIIKPGEGANLTEADKVTMEYECSLLDGTACYSSSTLGPKELILGRSVMEPGMNEGLRLLKPGAEAIFIFPPFLGYGLIGDGKKIPSRAIIVYNVNILQPQ
jgi:FKBP-type peptidyl-prolyl cis-trans isomerase FkpA